MNLFGIGTGELLVIMLIALLVLGPERLPQFIRQGAKMLRDLRSVTDQFTQELNRELKLDELLKEEPPKRPPAAPPVSQPQDTVKRIAPPAAQNSQPQPAGAVNQPPAESETPPVSPAHPADAGAPTPPAHSDEAPNTVAGKSAEPDLAGEREESESSQKPPESTDE